ncbi:hypothetical protein MTR67_041007 [Solanum verrucosum]|uniref:MULE transposase domain-containing protein n=1 Tax=Solanum verrucosum TaxID=315347 RepID=A0AAF0UK92_SOLVR|nr:hypothetical protein MTR67_041007 [Solanum verrucosum]
MIEEVDIIFNYGGSWVISLKLGYNIKFQHTWKVQQLLVTGPFGTYYVIEDNDGIKTLQYLFSKDFKVINFYVVDAHELRVFAANIIDHTESYSVNVEAATDCDYSDVEDDALYEMGNNCEIVEYHVEVLQLYEHEKERVVSDGLEKFKELEWNGKSATFKVKTLNPKHTCGDSFVNPLATYHTLVVYFKDEVQNNPKYPIKDMREILEKKFKLNVLKSKLKKAKTMALDKLEGGFKDDYNRLEAYGQELRQSNPGSDMVINISKDALEQGIRRFLRMYICFKALKDGWKSLRPIIGLDGTFLKEKCKGQLLVRVGQDSMNHFYPIAWVVVENENRGTWTWFIQLLRIFLELKNGETVTFMSDMQKGVLDVVANVIPEAHHRLCMRHIKSNWCKKWRSGEEKKLMWWCAWNTYKEEFKGTLKVLGKVDEDLTSDLFHFPVIKWCRAYFDTQCKNVMVDNNFTESFNSWILEARQKPIIKMLEEIRVKLNTMITYAFYCELFGHENGEGGFERMDHEDGESSHERNKKASSQKSIAYGPEIENEEDPTLRPMVISETKTRMEKRSRIFEGLRSKKIVFKGDVRGISTPSDLPYSPKKTTWKGKKAVTTGQLLAEVKKKRVK